MKYIFFERKYNTKFVIFASRGFFCGRNALGVACCIARAPQHAILQLQAGVKLRPTGFTSSFLWPNRCGQSTEDCALPDGNSTVYGRTADHTTWAQGVTVVRLDY